jgi:hypothetical protein
MLGIPFSFGKGFILRPYPIQYILQVQPFCLLVKVGNLIPFIIICWVIIFLIFLHILKRNKWYHISPWMWSTFKMWHSNVANYFLLKIWDNNTLLHIVKDVVKFSIYSSCHTSIRSSICPVMVCLFQQGGKKVEYKLLQQQ